MIEAGQRKTLGDNNRRAGITAVNGKVREWRQQQ
jgi:hypothetical protein